MPHNVLILTYWSYKDALIQTYTLPYLKILHRNLSPKSSIYLLTLEKPSFALSSSEREEVKKKLAGDGIVLMSIPYKKKGLLALIIWGFTILRLWFFTLTKKIKTIHSFCTPAGVIGYILSLLTGRRLVIDSFEPHAEAMVENGEWDQKSMTYRILFFFEKMMAKHARYIIATSTGMKAYVLEKYGVKLKNMMVKPACVDLSLFSLSNMKNKTLGEELNLEEKIVCVYAGKFGGIYLEKEVFDFFRIAHNYWGDKFRALLLTNLSDDQLGKYCSESELDLSVVIKKFVDHNEVPNYMSLASFGITPVKPVPSKKFCTPIKDGEYWALGLPVVITPDISDDSNIIAEKEIGAIIVPGDIASYQSAVKAIDDLIISKHEGELHSKIRDIAKQYRSFEIAEKVYKRVYQNVD